MILAVKEYWQKITYKPDYKKQEACGERVCSERIKRQQRATRGEISVQSVHVLASFTYSIVIDRTVMSRSVRDN